MTSACLTMSRAILALSLFAHGCGSRSDFMEISGGQAGASPVETDDGNEEHAPRAEAEAPAPRHDARSNDGAPSGESPALAPKPGHRGPGARHKHRRTKHGGGLGKHRERQP